jgi:hypothetical protein
MSLSRVSPRLGTTRTEDGRFDIKLKEEGRTFDPRWFPRFLGGVAVTLTGCMKTQDCSSGQGMRAR